ncbi:MAG: quinone-dependent dihydroorotate dehydrogenase [Ferruginibacter sp.]
MQLISKLSFIHQTKKLNTCIFAAMYKLLRTVLFLFDAEKVHYFSMSALKFLCRFPFLKNLITRALTPKNQSPFTIFNLQFPNRVGLGAGFDKNALYLNELSLLGFGFVEIGTITPKPQDGNPKPRLFRLKKDKALINRMGFNNDGAEIIAKRLEAWRASQAAKKDKSLNPMLIGGNLGKNKITANEDAWQDYGYCFNKLYNVVDYFVVNVSSPNTAGLRELQDKEMLRKILMHLQSLNGENKPLLLKIAPDLSTEQTDDVIDLCMEIKLHGLIVANTTISRSGLKTSDAEVVKIGAGGLSGNPLMEANTNMLSYIFQKTRGNIPIIASGGIFNGADAEKKFASGASLVQVWTGFIYEGPSIVKNICRQLPNQITNQPIK